MHVPASLRRQGIFRAAVWILGALAFTPATLSAQGPASKEYQIKAVFLFNFTQFAEWPATAFAGPDAPILIGILGQDPFGTAITEAVRDESVHNRRLLVRRSNQLADLKDCQVLFIGESEEPRLGEILTQLEGAAILLVSEIANFARRGGIIEFYRDGNKVRFEINPQAAKRHRIRLSPQLLSLGRIATDNRLPGGE